LQSLILQESGFEGPFGLLSLLTLMSRAVERTSFRRWKQLEAQASDLWQCHFRGQLAVCRPQVAEHEGVLINWTASAIAAFG
jgi:hypothetical protein